MVPAKSQTTAMQTVAYHRESGQRYKGVVCVVVVGGFQEVGGQHSNGGCCIFHIDKLRLTHDVTKRSKFCVQKRNPKAWRHSVFLDFFAL
jgi:hypothetical protein